MDVPIIKPKLNNGLTKFIFDEKWNSQQTTRQEHTPGGEIKLTYIGKNTITNSANGVKQWIHEAGTNPKWRSLN